jgi:hypothetical protein
MNHASSRPALFPFLVLAALMFLLPTGCDQRALIKQFTPEAEDGLARRFIAKVVDSNLDEAMSMLADTQQNAAGRKGLDEIAGLFRGGKIETIETVGALTNFAYRSGKKYRSAQLTYQLRLTTGWYIGTMVVTDGETGTKITGARFNPAADSLENLNRFALSGKSPVHYLFLAAVIAVPLFCLTTLVICLRSPMKRKWLWAVFVSLGFLAFRLDWTTGQFDAMFLSFHLFGASVLKSGPYAPWILQFGIPVGAFIFLIKRARLVAERKSQTPPESPARADS